MNRGRILAFALLCILPGCRGWAPRRVAPAAPAAAAMPRFEDVTARAGIRFTHFTGAEGRFLMPESVGPGGAFLDYDGDGSLDLFLVNGTAWPGARGEQRLPALYRGRGDGSFEDVTRAAGLAVPMMGMGCAVGDYDNDGRTDLLVTCLGQNRLFHNEGGGRFRDVTAGSGLDGEPRWAWHTSAAWLDYDRDGRLDLFVCRYVKWSPEDDIPCRSGLGKRTYCGPQQYVGDASALYRNLGGGRFRDVSAVTGIASAAGKGLGVVPLDENEDGWVDIMVTNDLVPNHLWRSESGRRFREVAQETGIAVGDTGQPRAGMGVDAADPRNDGGLAFGIGNFAGEGLALFSRGRALYSDRAAAAGLVPASLPWLTFGLLFLDADRDGWQDLVACNGHVDTYAGEADGKSTHRQPAQFFRNERGVFADRTGSAGPDLARPIVGRGSAWGDYDNDGRPDLLLCENGGPARLLRNVTADSHHWLGVRLVGTAGARDAYGAEVLLTAGGVTQRRWVRSGSSYLSQSDTRALFGLGTAERVERLEVRWLSGRRSLLEGVEPDRYLEISEPR